MSRQFWLWTDLETTGLGFYPDHPQLYKDDAVLEVAAVLTEPESLRVVSTFSKIVNASEDKLALMDDFVRDMHSQNGLLKAIHNGEGDKLELVDDEFSNWLAAHGAHENNILAGSSVKLDYEFLRRHFPQTFARLFYRVIDVSSFKEVFRVVNPGLLQRVELARKLNHREESDHRALSDIMSTLEEFKIYREYLPETL